MNKFLILCVGARSAPLFSSPPSPVPSDKRIILDLDLSYNVQNLFIHLHQVADSLIEALRIEPTKVVNYQPEELNNGD